MTKQEYNRRQEISREYIGGIRQSSRKSPERGQNQDRGKKQSKYACKAKKYDANRGSDGYAHRTRRRRKNRRKGAGIYLYLGSLVILCILCFFFGKKAGVKIGEGNGHTIATAGEAVNHAREETEWLKPGNENEILLVNKDNPLPQEYEVELMILPDGANRAAKEAYEPLCDMLSAGRAEGLAFEICSSYRDVRVQERLFAEDVAALLQAGYSYEAAYEETARETMPPGCSEHSTGLAFDIVALDYQMLDEGQERTEENNWLRTHCAEYGFILRYPEGKEEITGISYESWHFRYVGKEAAAYIMERGLTLEEYLLTAAHPAI